MHKIYLAVFFNLFHFLLLTGNPGVRMEFHVVDTSLLEHVKIQPLDIQPYLENEEFQYLKDPMEKKNNTFWQSATLFLKDLFRDISFLLRAAPLIVQVLLWGGVIILIFIAVTKTRVSKIFYVDKDLHLPGYDVNDPDREMADYDGMIKKEIASREYRNAVRLLFLKTVYELDKNNYIRYTKEKTNSDYRREISNPDMKTSYIMLSDIYNRVWYGLQELNEMKFQEFENKFDQFLTRVNA
jgi:hypothetical protein